MNLTKSERTRRALKKAAEELFSKYSLEKTSVAAICRESGLSNGTFYRHFDNKNEVFKEITNDMMKEFKASLNRVTGEGQREILRSFFDNAFNVLWKYKKRFIAFHEAEYRFEVIEREVDSAYMEALKRILNLKNDAKPWLKWFVVGSARFVAIWWIIFRNSPVPEETIDNLVKFVTKGLQCETKFDPEVIKYNLDIINRRKENTRERLLASAEELIGKKGYFNTSIYDITNLAGYAQGTFYVYFESKSQLLKELVLWANHNLRNVLKDASKNIIGRLNQEMRNYKAFLLFMKVHRNLYEIVRESEFIVDGAGKHYYEKILDSYTRALEKPIKEGEISQFDKEDLGTFLMGIGHFMGLDLIIYPKENQKDWNQCLLELSELLNRG
ncbi:MAG: TetR/AcrR family transcriptional regulator, partial [Petrotogales bacterium]